MRCKDTTFSETAANVFEKGCLQASESMSFQQRAVRWREIED
jgi:hypothetical protein